MSQAQGLEKEMKLLTDLQTSVTELGNVVTNYDVRDIPRNLRAEVLEEINALNNKLNSYLMGE